MFSKVYFFFFLLFFNSFFSLLNYFLGVGLSLNYFFPFFDCFNNFELSLSLDFFFFSFVFMVSLVMLMVSYFSPIYLDFYNNNKFFFLMFSFFFSMLILCFSASPILLMMGWDGLGICSIFLIMFYPNFTSLYNSILTMVFNRMGDVMLLMFFCYFIFNNSLFFFCHGHISGFLFLLGCLCCFTKSAQFPLSTWLPAAMSAPTPISAMVHSSTLVTAGILLMLNFFDVFHNYGFLDIFIYYSAVTFMLGGLGANMDYDFKKVIAFSTMSQISMVFFFLTSLSLYLGIFHMVLHAFFKTMIFVCSGIVFVAIFSNQQVSSVSPSNSNFVLHSIFFFFSVFCMSGLYFSSSFFTKDLALEVYSSSLNFFFIFILLLGSVLTLGYSWKLFYSIFYWFMTNSYSFVSKFSFQISLVLSFFFFFLINFLNIYFLDFMPFANSFDLGFFFFIFFSSLFLLFFSFMPFSGLFSKTVFFTSSFFYSYLSCLFVPLSNYFVNDHLFFKPYLFSIKSISYIYLEAMYNIFNLKIYMFYVIYFFMIFFY